jgi:hydroxypyruvate reductase
MTSPQTLGQGADPIADAAFAAQDTPRATLQALYGAGVQSVRGDILLEAARWDGVRWSYEADGAAIELDIPADGKCVVIGAGKAAAALALGMERTLGDRLDRGVIVVKYGHTEPLARIVQMEAGHPVPDQNSVNGTRAMIEALKGLGPQDRVFVLLTGGASSLLVDLIPGVTLEDKAQVTSLLLRSGATINEINIVRKALSNVKGGKLLRHIAPARAVTLLISDVPNGDFGTIGSGPTIAPEPGGEAPLAILERYRVLDGVPPALIAPLREAGNEAPDRHGADGARSPPVILLADSATLVAHVRRMGEQMGLDVRIVDPAMDGQTHESARAFAAAMIAARAEGSDRPILLISAGETTLEVTGSGKGGRNQEFALIAAEEIEGVSGVYVLAAGTDGTDGPTDAAGAFADGDTCCRARALGLDVAAIRADNDSYRLFESLGDLLVTGGSGTNVMDLVLGLVLPRDWSN